MIELETVSWLWPRLAVAFTAAWIASFGAAHLGGRLCALPWVTGPALYLCASNEGVYFTTQLAYASLLASMAVEALFAVYTLCSRRFNTGLAFSLSLLAYAVTASLVGLCVVDDPSVLQIVLALLACLWVYQLTNLTRPAELPDPIAPTRQLLWVRAVLGVGVLLLAYFAAVTLGPQPAGLIAAFPVLSFSLLWVVHLGGQQAQITAALSGRQIGRYGFLAFVSCLALCLPRVPVVWGFCLATLAALLAQHCAQALSTTKGIS